MGRRASVKRNTVQDSIDWAHTMDGVGLESLDLNKPASADSRVVLDTRWADDPVEGSHVAVKPRIRGRLKLPVLERRLSIH